MMTTKAEKQGNAMIITLPEFLEAKDGEEFFIVKKKMESLYWFLNLKILLNTLKMGSFIFPMRAWIIFQLPINLISFILFKSTN